MQKPTHIKYFFEFRRMNFKMHKSSHKTRNRMCYYPTKNSLHESKKNMLLSHKEFSTLSSVNVWRTLTCLISVTVFNFTHPPVLSALLLILSASRFLAPDSPLLVPAPFLFLVHRHGMTFPFLSDRNSLWTASSHTSGRFFFHNTRPAMFSLPRCCLSRLKLLLSV